LLLGKNRNRPGGALCAYAGYALAGDGGLMPGSAGEAASLAGPLPRAIDYRELQDGMGNLPVYSTSMTAGKRLWTRQS
jgi:hypothetical protein